MKDHIVQNGDSALRKTANPVSDEQFNTPGLAQIIERMADALDQEKDGVALAAPQIAIPLRIFVVRHDRLDIAPPGTTAAELAVYINPEFIRVSRRREEMDEGCLSVRNVYGKTLRHVRATIRAHSIDGTIFERGAGGILAQAFQHEIDHLDGMLFIDHAYDLVEINESMRAQQTGLLKSTRKSEL